MIQLIRATGLCAALLLSSGVMAQRDAAAPSPPAVAAKLATRGDIKGVRVYEIRMVRRADVLVVEADIQNTETEDRQVFYRFRWLDGGGMQVGDGESWKQLLVYGQQTKVVKGVAPSSAGADFRLEFNVE
ncbi:MAG: hypothetical protein A3E25_24315 [Burkholderiales bacterium RIFCSPHIGHO2_12_FULL_69_20]|nr:MAG: hypothetical protein A3E25_24315 [Burkholderiales bacterium RIFCSPHIGHO2_12_FULL_69_20]